MSCPTKCLISAGSLDPLSRLLPICTHWSENHTKTCLSCTISMNLAAPAFRVLESSRSRLVPNMAPQENIYGESRNNSSNMTNVTPICSNRFLALESYLPYLMPNLYPPLSLSYFTHLVLNLLNPIDIANICYLSSIDINCVFLLFQPWYFGSASLS